MTERESQEPKAGPLLRRALREQTVESYRAEYKELTADWRAIEAKAQNLITVVGIFIGASLAFLENFSPDFSSLQRILLVAAILSLVTSLVFCLLALNVTEVLAAPIGKPLQEFTASFLEGSDEELEADFSTFQDKLENSWSGSNSNVNKVINRKANRVFRAQASLIVAVALFACISVSIVVNPREGVANEVRSPEVQPERQEGR